eukprot:1757205-Amphidinium_carterae.1
MAEISTIWESISVFAFCVSSVGSEWSSEAEVLQLLSRWASGKLSALREQQMLSNAQQGETEATCTATEQCTDDRSGKPPETFSTEEVEKVLHDLPKNDLSEARMLWPLQLLGATQSYTPIALACLREALRLVHLWHNARSSIFVASTGVLRSVWPLIREAQP